MKFGKFHDEIWQISWSTTECCIFFIHEIQYRYKCNVWSPWHEIRQISWSTTECCIFFIHEIQYRYKWKFLAWNLVNSGFFFRTNADIQYYMLNRQEISWSTIECCIFHQNQSPWHEICQISPWNPPDFMNSGFFFRTNTDIQYYMVYHWMLYFSSEPKSLAWNLPDFMKFAWISPWNLLDFMNSGFFFRTNTDIQYYMVYHWMLYFSSEPKSLAWNSLAFMKSTKFHEIRQISCMKSAVFHAWNSPDFMKSKWAKDQWSYFYHCTYVHIWRRYWFLSGWNLTRFIITFWRSW